MKRSYYPFGDQAHKWVRATDPDGIWSCGHPLKIILHLGEYVWVEGAFFLENEKSQVTRVRDDKSSGYDEHGNCILSIPVEWCEYLSENDYECIETSIEYSSLTH